MHEKNASVFWLPTLETFQILFALHLSDERNIFIRDALSLLHAIFYKDKENFCKFQQPHKGNSVRDIIWFGLWHCDQLMLINISNSSGFSITNNQTWSYMTTISPGNRSQYLWIREQVPLPFAHRVGCTRSR